MVSTNHFNIINVYTFKIKLYIKEVLEAKFPNNE